MKKVFVLAATITLLGSINNVLSIHNETKKQKFGKKIKKTVQKAIDNLKKAYQQIAAGKLKENEKYEQIFDQNHEMIESIWQEAKQLREEGAFFEKKDKERIEKVAEMKNRHLSEIKSIASKAQISLLEKADLSKIQGYVAQIEQIDSEIEQLQKSFGGIPHKQTLMNLSFLLNYKASKYIDDLAIENPVNPEELELYEIVGEKPTL